jgi:photosystem II stability/assembly factor-like uncharacterized protein
VGDAGTVYRSFDGGATYMIQTVGAATLRGAAQDGIVHILVGDGGLIWRSTNNGGAWSSQSPAGAVNLRAVTMIDNRFAYAVGDAGTILQSGDGGATWAPQASGVGVRLNAVKFTDDQNGWVVGAAGTVLRTIDGGANWNPVVVGTPNELLAVDVSGSTVWVAGKLGTCWKSDGGFAWSPVNLRLDAQSDVRAIHLNSPTDIWLGGGGGFIRRSQDGGTTWTFPVHALQKPLSDLFFVGNTGWATAQGTRAVLRTTNLGTSWAFPAGSNTTRNWTAKLSGAGSTRGSSVQLNPVYPSTIYTLYGGTVYRSRDDGETWSVAATIPSASTPNSFLVSPKDSNVWLAAVRSPMRVVKTVDGGANWVTTRTDAFGDYGLPLEIHPDKPDTVFFGVDNDKLYRSTDFGSTWAAWGATTFRSPCDIVVVPESDSAVIQVGDGITGSGIWQIWRSNDAGASFKSIKTGSSGSETPGMATSRLRPTTSFATHWSSDGLDRTTNGGLTWSVVHTAGSAWGVDVAKDDPNCVIFGTYSGGQGYVALDGGNGPGSFSSTGLTGTNYSFLARDRATLLAYQSGTMWKMNITHSATTTSAQSIALTVPNGGEVWEAGSVHSVTWNSTNVGLARIEYRLSPGDPWGLLAEVAGPDGAYAWTIPFTPTTTAEVRVRDGWDNNPEDVSNAVFSIVVSGLTAGPDPIDLGIVDVGNVATTVINLENTSQTTVNVTNVTSGNPEFYVGRTSFAIGAGASDTLGLSYAPVDVGPDATEITIYASDPLSPHVLNVTGEGNTVVGVGDDLPTAFAAWQNQPNPFTGTTRIRYALPQRAQVSLEVYNVQGRRVATLVNETQEPGNYSVPFGSGGLSPGGRVGRLPSGVYFYRFTAGSFTTTHKMLMLQ